jgi:hypothetical protein
MRSLLKHSTLLIAFGVLFVSCSGAKPLTAVFWKKNPYKTSKKDKEEDIDFQLGETEEVLAENERHRARKEKEQLKKNKKDKDQEIELAKKAEKSKKYKKVNDGTFNFY